MAEISGEYMQPKVAARPHIVVKILLFVASVLLAGVIAWFTYGDSSAGFLLFVCPLSCALPLFAVLTWILRKKGNLGTLMPLMVLPLLFTLCFAYMIYERNPQNMFKMHVMDPIPAGVTNIQGRVQDELDDVVITFQASPEAIDTIITQKGFERHKVNDGYPDRDLPEYSWKGNWIGYVKRFHTESGKLTGYIHMWVDPEQSIVIIRSRGF